jgi:subtilisin family serine protease
MNPMITYVVIPRRGLGLSIQELASRPNELATASATVARDVLKGSGLEERPLLTAIGLITSKGQVTARGIEAAKEARQQGSARVLEGLNVILADDLDDKTIALLRDRAEVLENVEIPGIEPVATESGACTDWHLSQINVAAARKKGLTGAGVRVGILDTGIDATHPEFSGRHIQFMEYDTNGFPLSTRPRDSGSHGTHVAGLVAGATYGVAPGADLAVAAVLTTVTPKGNSGYLAQILAGLNWLAHSNHAPSGSPISQCPILNASLGSPGYNSYLYSSLQVVRQVPAAQLSGAIGNAGRSGVNNHGSPGNYDIVAGVGATDPNDVVADFSDWGVEISSGALKPDLSAPGVKVCSAIPGSGYAPKSGTSMASPIITGAQALLIEQTPSLARKPATLFTRLLRLVDPAPVSDPKNYRAGYNRIGAGRLDLTHI